MQELAFISNCHFIIKKLNNNLNYKTTRLALFFFGDFGSFMTTPKALLASLNKEEGSKRPSVTLADLGSSVPSMRFSTSVLFI
ncbi:MAG: hypothetical protein KAS32_15405 [Candidatus Peribacteraceae bacterium]|nr:hypothetical protein [Candidatus Peribacteraceae bacterium]